MLLDTCRCDYNGRLGWTERDYFPPTLLNAALAAVNAVDAGAIARNCTARGDIPARVHAARVAAVRAALNQPGDEPENQ